MSGGEATMHGCRGSSSFYGIVIAMYYREHGVPHFHATYAGEIVVVSIQSGGSHRRTRSSASAASDPGVV
jgi:Domain of unknown function (DUF4160)